MSVCQDDIENMNFWLVWKFHIVRNQRNFKNFLPLSQLSEFVQIYSMIYSFVKRHLHQIHS